MQIFFCYFCFTIILIYVSALDNHWLHIHTITFHYTFRAVCLGEEIDDSICVVAACLIVANRAAMFSRISSAVHSSFL